MLGVFRSSSAPYIITEIDESTSTIFAKNPFNNEFAERVAFVATSEEISSATCDRKEFIGRNSSLETPCRTSSHRLRGRDGAGLDPCAAIQTTIELAPNEAREVIFLLGEAESKSAAQAIVANFRQAGTSTPRLKKC